MTSNELILQFLDGTLSGDQEAEFLHILSVSPERRELLRSFMRQSELFARDKNAITVPYAAEQKLWERLGAVIPIGEGTVVTEPLAAGLASTSMLGHMASSTLALIAALVLTLGIGIGYTVGNSGSTALQTVTRWIEHPQSLAQNASHEQNLSQRAIRTVPENFTSSSDRFLSTQLPMFQLGSPNGMRDLRSLLIAYLNKPNAAEPEVVSADIPSSSGKGLESISYVDPRTVHQRYSIRGEAGSPFHLYAESQEAPTKTLLQRFEFSFLESFGRELPSSYANNVSMPILTNAAASVFFQVLPNSEALWIGASGGAANFSRKHLTTQAGNPGDPLQQQMVAVYAHTPANWAGAFLQYRLPLFAQTDLTMTGGYGLSTAGSLAMGEVGVRYDATRDVGFTVGLRGVQLTYNLAPEEAATMKGVRGPLVVPNGVANSTPSYNVEINTGLFFHF